MKKNTSANRQLDPTRRSKTIEDFERAIRYRIIGQEPAVEAVVDVFQMFQAGLSSANKPIGTLLFLGPTGSGKTRVTQAMAETLFGDEACMVRINCGEFQHSHEIAKLIGCFWPQSRVLGGWLR